MAMNQSEWKQQLEAYVQEWCNRAAERRRKEEEGGKVPPVKVTLSKYSLSLF